MSHRFGQVHIPAAAYLEHGIACDYVFFQGGEGDGWLDGGARNRAGRIGHFLIDDSEDAAGIRIHGDNRTVEVAERFDGGAADEWIVKIGNVTQCGVDGFFAREEPMTR